MDHGARPVHHELMAGRRTLWCEEPHRDVARRESRVKGSPPVATNDGVEDEMGWRWGSIKVAFGVWCGEALGMEKRSYQWGWRRRRLVVLAVSILQDWR
jgi:hypothetical protein